MHLFQSMCRTVLIYPNCGPSIAVPEENKMPGPRILASPDGFVLDDDAVSALQGGTIMPLIIESGSKSLPSEGGTGGYFKRLEHSRCMWSI
jgi:hypothetical protein